MNQQTIPKLPKGWTATPISEIAETASGGTPSRRRKDFFGGSIPWVKSGELNNATLHTTEEFLTDLGFQSSSAKMFPEGTLCIALYGATVGKLAILGSKAATNQAVCGILLHPLVHTRYLFYFLLAQRRNLIALGKGGAQPNISQEIVRRTVIPLAPFSEQTRIISKVDELVTKLDAGILELRKAQAQVKRYRQAVLKVAVTGELTREWREAHKDELESASELLSRILKERRARSEGNQRAQVKAPGEPPVSYRSKEEEQISIRPDVSQMPSLPNEWEWARLDALAVIKGGITKDSQRKLDGRSVPYLRVANVQRGYLDLTVVKEIKATEKEIADLKLERGDILFNEGGDRDKLGRGWVWNDELPECIHQNHVFRARLYLPDMSPKFVSMFGNTFGLNYFLREGKQTTNLASINLTKLSALPVPVPPSEEQKRIVEEIERAVSIADALQQVINTSLHKAERVRQSILKDAFEGKLVPQDPNDEPAELLLERIKLERAKREAEKQAQKKSNRKRSPKNRPQRTERPAA